ncbi:MAG TPA: NADH:flavin oxidoreductase/NADH oxidase [Acidobacteriaceae bacterium]
MTDSANHLFSPLTLRGITLPNRIAVSPMCEYSSVDGLPNDWHLVHLGSRAIGGAGLVITEAAAVSPEGRITPADLGIWNDEQIAPLQRITAFLHEHGAYAGIQLAHAGRKASMAVPWAAVQEAVGEGEGGWTNVLAPSPVRFADNYPLPQAVDTTAIRGVVRAFGTAAARALQAGFDVAEIHAAHGYLLHQFLSPRSNQRTDEYGGSFENRTRLLLEVVRAVRGVWPENLPVFVRISATEWAAEGSGPSWDAEQSVALARLLRAEGVDLVDVSTGGNLHGAKIPVGPGFQVPFAERVRREAQVPTAAVGLITEPEQADAIVRSGEADLVLLARELLRDPYWPTHAAQALGQAISWPVQYERAASGKVPHREPIAPHSKQG